MPVIHETGLITAPVPVYFETFAPAAATGRATIVMVHGGAHSGACYQRTADGRRGWAYLFAERGYRSVVPDWPGTGRSGYIPLDRLNGATVMEGTRRPHPRPRRSGHPDDPFDVGLLRLAAAGASRRHHRPAGGRRARPPGNIQKAAPVYAETEREIETEASGQRVRIDKSAPVVPTRDFVERKLIGASRYFPRERIAGYAASLRPIPPNILLERQNVHGRQVRVSDPGKLAGKRVLVITGTDDLDHAREVDGAIVTWLNGNGAKADFCFLADRGIVGNGHMLMLEDNSDEIAGIILDWLEKPATSP